MHTYYTVNILTKEESSENENISACSNENIGCLCSTLKDSYEMVQKKSMVLRSGVVNNGMSGKDKDL